MTWLLSTSISSLLCAHSRSSPLAPGLFKPRGAWPHECHTSSSYSSSWPDTDRAPSFPTGLPITGKRTRGAQVLWGGRRPVTSFSFSLPILALGITSFFPDPSTRTHARVIGTSMDHDFTTTVFVEGGGASPASAPLGQAASSFHTPPLTSSAPLLTLLFLSSPLS